MLCLCSVVCCFVVFVLRVFLFFGAGLYGVVWFSFRIWTVSVPFKLCSVPDIQLVVAVRRESAHSGRMRLGGGDVVLPQKDHELLHAVQPTEEKLLLEKMYYLFITAIPGTGTVLAK